VKYQADLQAALDALRAVEFEAGRYNPVIPFLSEHFPLGPNSPAPGRQHDSIEEALGDSDADGTRSILDLDHISEEPDFCAVTPLADADLQRFFGTTRPTRAMIEGNHELFEDIERGHGIAIVFYKDDTPDGIFFAGYSFD